MGTQPDKTFSESIAILFFPCDLSRLKLDVLGANNEKTRKVYETSQVYCNNLHIYCF